MGRAADMGRGMTRNPSFALGRLKAGVMNKTEQLYGSFLDRAKKDGGGWSVEEF